VRGEVPIGFWWGNLRERPLGRPRRRREDNIKMDFRKWDGAHTGSIWLRIGSCGGHLLMR